MCLCGSSRAQPVIGNQTLGIFNEFPKTGFDPENWDTVELWTTQTTNTFVVASKLKGDTYGETNWGGIWVNQFTSQAAVSKMFAITNNANILYQKPQLIAGHTLTSTGTNWLDQDITNVLNPDEEMLYTFSNSATSGRIHVRFFEEFRNLSAGASDNLDQMYFHGGGFKTPELQINGGSAVIYTHAADIGGSTVVSGSPAFYAPPNLTKLQFDVYCDTAMFSANSNYCRTVLGITNQAIGFYWFTVSDTNGNWLGSSSNAKADTNSAITGFYPITGYINGGDALGHILTSCIEVAYKNVYTNNTIPWVLNTPTALAAKQTGQGTALVTWTNASNFNLPFTLLEWNPSNTSWSTLADLFPQSFTNNQSSYSLSNLLAVNYQFRVTAHMPTNILSQVSSIVSLNQTNIPPCTTAVESNYVAGHSLGSSDFYVAYWTPATNVSQNVCSIALNMGVSTVGTSDILIYNSDPTTKKPTTLVSTFSSGIPNSSLPPYTAPAWVTNNFNNTGWQQAANTEYCIVVHTVGGAAGQFPVIQTGNNSISHDSLWGSGDGSTWTVIDFGGELAWYVYFTQ